MAINKNFVIKNGVELITNLLVGDSTLNKVGIATTVPGYTLHIGVGGGARGGIGATDITVTGIATIGVANSNSGALSVTGISTFEGLIDANGGVSARTAAVQDLTDNRVVIAGTGGELEDSANLTFDGSTLTVSGDLDPTNVSIASTLQVAGVSTFLSGVLVSGIGTFDSDIDAEGTVTVGTGITLQPHGGASFAGIVTVGGNLLVTGDYSVDEISARNLILTGIATIPTLGVTGLGTFEKLTVGTGVTLQEHGGVSIAGITTINGNLLVGGDILPNSDGARDLGASGNEFKDLFIDGTANIDSLVADTADINGGTIDAANIGASTPGTGSFTTLSATGNVDLGNATGDTITATGRFDSDLVPSSDGARDLGDDTLEWNNLFIDGTAHIDTLDVDEAATVTTQLSVGSGVTAFANGNVAAAGIVTANGGVKVGSAISIHTNGNLGVTGILTAKEFVGVFTSAGGAGVGIGSTTGLVGYGFTFINFKGPGVSTVFASSTTGIATIFFQGGGSGVGAAGTWTPEGSIGISTSKSVGVNTTAINDPDLQGIGNTFQGLYIGNGMIMNDNALNGNHYIGTAFGGMMAGPVTVNGVLTVDGNYVVV